MSAPPTPSWQGVGEGFNIAIRIALLAARREAESDLIKSSNVSTRISRKERTVGASRLE